MVKKKYTSLVVLGGLISIIVTAYFLKSLTNLTSNIPNKKQNINSNLSFLKFSSDEEFKKYFNQSQNTVSFNTKNDVALLETTDSSNSYSQTNIQVFNIDEPDIIKTNGKQIFYSQQQNYFVKPLPMPLINQDIDTSPSEILPQINNKTFIISDEEKITLENSLDTQGEMLILNNVLVSFNTEYPNNKINAFNIADTNNPVLLWSKLLENSQIITSRLFENKIYLVTTTYPEYNNPCPINIFGSKIACTEIYHSNFLTNSNQITTVSKINPASGEIEKQISFASSYETTIYMSENNIYVAFLKDQNYQNFYLEFYKSDDAKSILNEEINQKITNLDYYDISNESKFTEINIILENYKNNLSAEDRANFEQKINSQIDKYTQKNLRNITTTSIVKIENKNLNIEKTANIPGKILNQFSIDEYDNKLRIATTIQNNFISSDFSKNDLYILDNNLNKIGEYLDFGEGERIYSVRFIKNQAYIVTFKQIDPFFIFDISNPNKPVKTGELKIPGFSSYLHPLENNLILGIGKEDNFVKLSLFDVSNPQSPNELSNFILENEYYTEILDNHKAFLVNTNNKQFFIPSFDASYIFSFKNNELKIIKKVNQQNLKRGVYLNNKYYFVNDEKITSYDFENLNLVDELNF